MPSFASGIDEVTMRIVWDVARSFSTTASCRRPLIGALESYDHFAKYSAAFEPREAALDIVEGDFSVNDW